MKASMLALLLQRIIADTKNDFEVTYDDGVMTFDDIEILDKHGSTVINLCEERYA